MASLSTRDLMANAADADMQQMDSDPRLLHQQQQQDQQQQQQQLHDSEQLVSLDDVRRSLNSPAQAAPIHGYLLKRSENLRIWNQRWFSLDPITARMEYRLQRSDPYPRGTILFQADSTITVSPINFHGAKQYDGCCFYIGTAGKKEFFLAAETPAAAKAWVSTLRASAVVLKAHREAMEAEGGAPSKASMRALAAATTQARAAAKEAAKEISEANQRALLSAASSSTSSSSSSSSSSTSLGAGIMTPFAGLSAFSLLPSSTSTGTASAPPQASHSAPNTKPSTKPSTSTSTSTGTTADAAAPSTSPPVEGQPSLAAQQKSSSTGSSVESSGRPAHSQVVSCNDPSHAHLQSVMREKDDEIRELTDLLQMREESLGEMSLRLQDAAVAAEKAADAAQHMGRERDCIRVEAARLCSDMEQQFESMDKRMVLVRSERDRALSALATAAAEIQRLHAVLGITGSQPMLVPGLSSAHGAAPGNAPAPEPGSWEATEQQVPSSISSSLNLPSSLPGAPSGPDAFFSTFNIPVSSQGAPSSSTQSILTQLAPPSAPAHVSTHLEQEKPEAFSSLDLLSALPAAPTSAPALFSTTPAVSSTIPSLSSTAPALSSAGPVASTQGSLSALTSTLAPALPSSTQPTSAPTILEGGATSVVTDTAAPAGHENEPLANIGDFSGSFVAQQRAAGGEAGLSTPTTIHATSFSGSPFSYALSQPLSSSDQHHQHSGAADNPAGAALSAASPSTALAKDTSASSDNPGVIKQPTPDSVSVVPVAPQQAPADSLPVSQPGLSDSIGGEADASVVSSLGSGVAGVDSTDPATSKAGE